MTTITTSAAALYQEQVARTTPRETIDQYLAELAEAKTRDRRTSIAQRIALAKECLEGSVATADTWIAEACRAKDIPLGTPLESEETSAGPMATVRYLRLLIRSLEDIQRHGRPQLPGRIDTAPGGQLRVQVLPTRGLFDSVLFQGFRADVWMQPGITRRISMSTWPGPTNPTRKRPKPSRWCWAPAMCRASRRPTPSASCSRKARSCS